MPRGVRVQPTRVAEFRIGLGQLLQHRVADAEGGRIDQITVPQGQIGHTAVGEVAEILQIPFQTDHLSGQPSALLGQPGAAHAAQHERRPEQQRAPQHQGHGQLLFGAAKQERGQRHGNAEDARRQRLSAHGARGAQQRELVGAGRVERLLQLVAVLIVLERRVHPFQVERRGPAAFGRGLQHAQRRLLGLAEIRRRNSAGCDRRIERDGGGVVEFPARLRERGEPLRGGYRGRPVASDAAIVQVGGARTHADHAFVRQ